MEMKTKKYEGTAFCLVKLTVALMNPAVFGHGAARACSDSSGSKGPDEDLAEVERGQKDKESNKT